MSDATVRVVAYVDFVSPFSWLAAVQLPEVEARTAAAGRRLHFEYRPVLLPAILDARGLVAAGEVKEKRDHELRRIDWRAQELQRSFVPPEKHPFVSLRSLRAAARFQGTESMGTAVRALFAAGWERGEDLTRAEVVERSLREAGLDIAGLDDWIQSDECKALVRANTDEALASSVFGVPSFVTPDGRLFWDRTRCRCWNAGPLGNCCMSAPPCSRRSIGPWRLVAVARRASGPRSVVGLASEAQRGVQRGVERGRVRLYGEGPASSLSTAISHSPRPGFEAVGSVDRPRQLAAARG